MSTLPSDEITQLLLAWSGGDSQALEKLKRGAGSPHLSFEESLFVSPEPPTDLAALDNALNGLEKIDPRTSQVVELPFFGGLSVKEAAEVLNVSEDTVKRDWRMAKLRLLRELRPGEFQ